ncbi:MAG TPA: TIGR04563 family protein [Polyangiales bacterium]|nr:TIGR04563 family protein [Polyangiales bacterium]
MQKHLSQSAFAYGIFTNSEVFLMSTDKRKQSLYFPETMLKDLQHEADRLDRSLSWVVQRCVRIGMLELKKLPSTDEPARQNPS